MKHLIFIIDSIQSGGAERALVSLLNNLDYKKYKVDLLYFYHEEEYFRDDIPIDVKIIDPSKELQLALSSQSYVFKKLKEKKNNKNCWKLIFMRLWFGLMGKINKKSYHRRRINDWKRMKKFVPDLPGTYDIAIAYMENSPVYYTVDKVKAKKYIVWQRTDYLSSKCNPKLDKVYFEKADRICVLSDFMMKSFISVFPFTKGKIRVVPNIIDINEILRKANEIDLDKRFLEYKGKRIISIGTLRSVKRYDTAIKACSLLKKHHIGFKWYVLGSGELKEKLSAEIHNYRVEDSFILLGNKKNPYPYLKESDVFVQCSEREGLSTTLYEAKCLIDCIVVTDAPGLSDQIENEVNGFVVPIGDYEKLAEKILTLLEKPIYREQFHRELSEFRISETRNNRQLEKFYQLVEDL